MNRSAISKGIMLGNAFCPDLRLYYFCRETGIPPAWGTANEKRFRPLIFLITRGCGVFKIDAGEFPLRQGDCFVLFPQKGISWQSDALDPWEWLCLELTGRDAAAALESLGFSREHPVFTFRDPAACVDTAEELFARLDAGRHRPLLLQAALFSFLTLLEDARAGSGKDPAVQRACSYIRACYRQPITVAGIAEMLSLSRSHFSRLFRRETGETVQEYLIGCRISAARRMLRESGLPIGQVAAMAGFPSTPAFTRAFHKRVGFSPSAYRGLSSSL